jgi:hypothetical protein
VANPVGTSVLVAALLGVDKSVLLLIWHSRSPFAVEWLTLCKAL